MPYTGKGRMDDDSYRPVFARLSEHHYRAMFFLQTHKGSKPGRRVVGLVREGRIEEALNITDGIGGGLPVMKVLSAGMSHSFEPAGAMESAAAAEVSAMKRGLTALDTIITLSPLLGLLGTIIGMINSFNIMASAGLGQPHAVTGGVAEALVCTAAGISVAVVTLVPYNYFLARVERETDVIEMTATRLELAMGAPVAVRPEAALCGEH